VDWISAYGHISNVFESFKPRKYFVRFLSKASGLSPKLKSPGSRLTLLLLTFGGSVAVVHCGDDTIFVLRYVTLNSRTVLRAELV
jgi:hypothetical protein